MPSSYDPMLAKIVAHGADRESALAALRTALKRTILAGMPTNLTWLLDLLAVEAVEVGKTTTQTANDVSQSMPDRKLAIAAGVAHSLDRSRGEDPWTAIGPLRLTGTATIAFHGEDWEELRGIQHIVGEWMLESDGKASPLRWWRNQQAIWTINLGDEVAQFAIVARNDSIEIAGNGGRWPLQSGRRPIRKVNSAPTRVRRRRSRSPSRKSDADSRVTR